MASHGAIDLSMNSPSPCANMQVEETVEDESVEPVKPKKKLSVLPTFLPPCRVCNATASGYHYGANTCEACKAFFRRSLGQRETFKPCQRDGKCADNPKGKITCSACRHKKCLSIGMTREGCKKGRYTYEKRTQDTREVKRIQANDSFSKHFDLHQCAETLAMLTWQFQQSFPQLLPFYTSKDEIDSRVQELITNPLNRQEAKLLYSPGNEPSPMLFQWYETVNEHIMAMRMAEGAEDHTTEFEAIHDLIFTGWSITVEQILYGMTSFAKSIPGYSDLLIDDKIILLKRGRVETLNALRHRGMYADLECSAIYYMESEDLFILPFVLLRKILGDDFIESLKLTISKMKKFSLTVEDTAVLLAFFICMPDRVGLQRSDQVEKIQDFLLPVLQYTLKKNHPDKPNIFPEILLFLPLLREHSETNVKSLGALRHKVRREATPLIFEILQE